jgi:phenylpropionate dioxygenase-like ring-hydroxylating dioxygenase large terminal subunit|tara:strand:- start:603 stop:1838 length:1236 start_codon:yes stop_codon:yes gene_type:complete
MKHELQIEILKELMSQLDENRNVDAGVQYKMPTTSYVCPEQASLEQKEFFQNHPQLIGLSGDLPEPGTFFTMDDFGTPILATRDKEGEFHAFLNACRHRSVRVTDQDRGKKTVFMCPFHHWSYANTGDLVSIPNEEHFGTIDKSCFGLLELPAVERHGMLWVHPQVDGHLDLREVLGADLDDELGSFCMDQHQYLGNKTIDMNLNWKLANDTFGETYHFGKLHKDTLGRLYIGNNQHFEEFGRHHRFVTANHGIHALRELPEADWQIDQATFVMYHLFPNVQLLTSRGSTTLIRIYPHADGANRSVTQVSFYYSEELIAASEQSDNAADGTNVYDMDTRGGRVADLEANLEVFHSTIELEDYVMGEMQQKAAANGQLKEIIFGRNEPALHHFHTSYREALGQPPLEALNEA